MEKLIELLNEYNHSVKKYSDRRELKNSIDNPGTKYISLSSVGAWKIYLWIISREYGFIKWLVQNLKINMDEVRKHGYITKTYDLDEPGEGYSYLDWILMLLSIQENPIEFLCEMLKDE